MVPPLGRDVAKLPPGMSPQRRPPDAADEFLTVAEVADTLKLSWGGP
jgi:hypothetical protein